MKGSTTRRVFLVDDHPILRRGLKGLIQRNSNLTVVGEAGSAEEALEKLEETTPHLAIVDISLEGMDGLELTRRIRDEHPDVEVLILSMHDDARYIEKAIEAGASGYVLKDNVNDIIENATRKVLAGEQFLSHEIQDKLQM